MKLNDILPNLKGYDLVNSFLDTPMWKGNLMKKNNLVKQSTIGDKWSQGLHEVQCFDFMDFCNGQIAAPLPNKG